LQKILGLQIANLQIATHAEGPQIKKSLQIFVFLEAWGKMIHEKNLKQKIL
jgi:hypothetical protein